MRSCLAFALCIIVHSDTPSNTPGDPVVSAEEAVAAAQAMFDLPRHVTFPTSFGMPFTGETGRPDWESNPPAWRADYDRLVRQNIYSLPAPPLSQIMRLSSSETQAETRRLTASVRPHNLKRKLADVPTLLSDDLSLVPANSPAQNLGSAVGEEAVSGTANTGGSLLNPTDLLTILNAVSEGVNTGHAMATGSTTTPSPVAHIANGLTDIMSGAYQLQTAVHGILAATNTSADATGLLGLLNLGNLIGGTRG